MRQQSPASEALARPIWREPAFWLALALSLLTGAIYNALPVSFPVFKRVFGISLEEMGRTQFLFFGSALGAGLGGGWFVGHLGLRRALVVALVFFAVTLVAIGSSSDFRLVLLGAFCFGLAIASVIIMTLSLISERFPRKLQTVYFLAGISDAIGSALGPAVLGSWFTYADSTGRSWRTGYYIAAAAPLILAGCAWQVLGRPGAERAVQSEGRPAPLSQMKAILCGPTIYAIGVLALLHGLTQGGAISFFGQLFQRNFRIDAAQAAYLLSLRSIGNFGGRSLLAWVTGRWRISELAIIATCSFGAVLTFVATIVAPSYESGLFLFGLAGGFSSATGPSLNSMVGSRFAGQTAMAFALFAGINCVGAAGGAYVIGAVGNRLGVGQGIWFVPVFGAALALGALTWSLRNRMAESKDTRIVANETAS